MWKVLFEYSDKSKCTITGAHKEIPLRLAIDYHNLCGIHAIRSIYQQYPKKDNPEMDLMEKIEELEQREFSMEN